MTRNNDFLRIAGGHIVVGGVLGFLVLHPITMAAYWYEFLEPVASEQTIWGFVLDRFADALQPRMLAMSLVFVLLGGLIGLGFGTYHFVLYKSNRLLSLLAAELGADVDQLVSQGESEFLEFKAAARWNKDTGSVDKRIELNIAKSIAAFLNHQGGHLLIGVNDEGQIVGLESDYKSLRKVGRDGFELFLMTLVKNKLGGAACTNVHVVFHSISDLDVCRVIVEPARNPIYLREKGVSEYFVRSGNSNRKLDIEQALQHVLDRYP